MNRNKRLDNFGKWLDKNELNGSDLLATVIGGLIGRDEYKNFETKMMVDGKEFLISIKEKR